jgi:EpsI family protein
VSRVRRWQILGGFLLLFVCADLVFGRADFVPERRSFDVFPREIAGYAGRHVPVSNEALRQLDLTDYLSRNYEKDGRLINVYVGFHGSQRRGSVIHSPQHCLPANGWYIVGREQVPLPGGPPGVVVNRMEVAFRTSRQLIYYWYQGRGRVVAGEYVATVYRSLDAGIRGRTDEALVRFATSYDDDGSEKALQDFVRAVTPHLPAYLPE